MNMPLNFVGIDIANLDFVGSIFKGPGTPIQTLEEISNDFPGFVKFDSWLINNHATTSNSVSNTT